ncbi:MAG: CBS domain-containing protein [Candidatus Bathyarchaeota archaeon]|nr:MAG: CBS domain-containing protein [Candidatus Bathyarchaeota archaeon]
MENKINLREEFPTVMDRAYAQFKKHRFVKDIMTRDVTTIPLEASMAEATRVMGAKHIGSLIVESDGKPLGIVTERDLLSKVLVKGKNPKKISVREVMSAPLITIEPEATIKEAARTMFSKKGRLAVFRGGELVGIITAADLIRSLPETSETLLKVDDVMTKRVVMVPSNTSVEEVAQIMGEKRIGSVLVTRRGKPFGIFTERDLLTTFITRGKPLKTQVGKAVSSPLITIPSGTSIHQTALTMALKHIRRLPVVKNKEIVGIITARDLAEAYAK